MGKEWGDYMIENPPSKLIITIVKRDYFLKIARNQIIFPKKS